MYRFGFIQVSLTNEVAEFSELGGFIISTPDVGEVTGQDDIALDVTFRAIEPIRSDSLRVPVPFPWDHRDSEPVAFPILFVENVDYILFSEI